MKVEYSSNNSGGSWWLTDEQWRALEQDGWAVEWFKDKEPFSAIRLPDKDGRWLGALAKRATITGLGLREAVERWERVTGECSTDAGCPCCGQPHTFTLYDDDGKYIESGPHASYSASW